ncbi:MAG: hypothetical protein AAGM16_13965 [Pseudomonadota bacterium]
MRVTTTHHARSSHESAAHFKILAGVCFVGMLPVALVASLSRWRWQPWPPGRNGYRSAWWEAKNAAKTAAAIAVSV